MKKRCTSLLVIVLSLALLITGCGQGASNSKDSSAPSSSAPASSIPSSSSNSKKPIILRLGHSVNEKSDWHKALEVFAKEVDTRTNGEIEVQIFANESLGPELDNITAIQQGTAEMVVSGDSMMNWAPLAAILGIPYAIRDFDHINKVVKDPEIGGKIEADIVKNVKLRPLGYFIRSARNLTTNKKVETMDDLKGLKLRIPNIPLHQKLWNAYGASANPMAFSEVFTALQNGTIDAQENPYTNIIAANLYEVQKYLVKTEHLISWIYVLIGEDVWQKLSQDQQTALKESAEKMMEFQQQYLKNELLDQEKFLKENMEFIEVDKTPFIKKAQEVMKVELSPELYELYEKIVAIK